MDIDRSSHPLPTPRSRPDPASHGRSGRPRPDRAGVDVEMDIDAPPSAVWRALTTGAGLDWWMGAGSSIDARPGGTLEVADVVGGRPRRGRVDRVERDRLIEFEWWPADRPGLVSRVAIRLDENDGATTVRVNESVPVHGGVEARRRSTAQSDDDGGPSTGPVDRRRRAPGFRVPGGIPSERPAGKWGREPGSAPSAPSARLAVGSESTATARAGTVAGSGSAPAVLPPAPAAVHRAGWLWRLAMVSLATSMSGAIRC